ncbi:hypothetical protein NKI32_30885 [Mesorhizobium sp. M0761]|uniref:hypothetical protein n=1 Tax=Mesorhizobium sp. M0761 TaxID=2956994 RepID=UPI00333B74EB
MVIVDLRFNNKVWTSDSVNNLCEVLLRRRLSPEENLECTLVIVVQHLVLAADNIIIADGGMQNFVQSSQSTQLVEVGVTKGPASDRK